MALIIPAVIWPVSVRPGPPSPVAITGTGLLSLVPNADASSNIGTSTTRWLGVHAKIIRVHDFSTDPVVNGEMTLNGTDVKVMSGGTVRNLSNIP